MSEREHRHPLRQRPRPPRRRGPPARGRARGLPDRDRLRPRRRRAERPRRRRHLRRQGPPRLQPAHRARRRPRRRRAPRRLHGRGPRARRPLLARPADAGAAAPRRTPASPSSPPPASPAWRCACRCTRSPSACSRPSAARWPRPRPTPPAGSAPPRPPTCSTASAAASPPCSTAAPARSASNSTILGFEDGAPVLLRPGGLPVEAIAEALGRPVVAPAAAGHHRPGPARLALRPARAASASTPPAPGPDEVWLGFGPEAPARPGLNLSPVGRPRRGRRRTSSPTCARSTRWPRARARPASPWRRCRAPASASRSTTGWRAPPPRARRAMSPWLAVFLGAGLGGALRHGVNLAAARLLGTGFPFGTLTVNVLGCFAHGRPRRGLRPRARPRPDGAPLPHHRASSAASPPSPPSRSTPPSSSSAARRSTAAAYVARLGRGLARRRRRRPPPRPPPL